jgi:hypothetical protein
MSKALVVLLAFLLTQCETTNSQENIFYARNASVSVNGVTFSGLASVPATERYRLKAKFRKKFDQVRLLTCAREQIWDGRSDEFETEYVPNDIERSSGCYLRLEFYSKDAEFYWFILSPSFDIRERMPARVMCNGPTIQAIGHLACQSRAGLLQRVTFTESVQEFVGSDCHDFKSRKILDSYEFEMPREVCTVVYESRGRTFRLLLVGYDKSYVVGE